jgi:hypothetical protein
LQTHKQTETTGEVFRDFDTQETISAAPAQSFNPTAMRRLEGRPVVCFPEQLRLHPTMKELGWTGVIDEFNNVARLKNQFVPQPILITTNGTILAGFGLWRLAVFERRHEIPCIEYSLGEDESLQFILTYHQSGRGWNDFIRIRLALKLQLYFQQRARGNMRAGGRYKGLANLPEAQHIDVRVEIARFAGVGARNVSNVKTILQTAHPRLIEALTDGRLSINRAVPWCKVPKAQQVEQFTNYLWERAIHKVIRQSIGGPKKDESILELCSVLEALQQQEARQPGSTTVRVDGRLRHTVILVGQDLLAGPHSQMGFKLT